MIYNLHIVMYKLAMYQKNFFKIALFYQYGGHFMPVFTNLLIKALCPYIIASKFKTCSSNRDLNGKGRGVVYAN